MEDTESVKQKREIVESGNAFLKLLFRSAVKKFRLHFVVQSKTQNKARCQQFGDPCACCYLFCVVFKNSVLNTFLAILWTMQYLFREILFCRVNACSRAGLSPNSALTMQAGAGEGLIMREQLAGITGRQMFPWPSVPRRGYELDLQP